MENPRSFSEPLGTAALFWSDSARESLGVLLCLDWLQQRRRKSKLFTLGFFSPFFALTVKRIPNTPEGLILNGTVYSSLAMLIKQQSSTLKLKNPVCQSPYQQLVMRWISKCKSQNKPSTSTTPSEPDIYQAV